MKALFTILFTGLLAFSVSAKEATYKGYIINANGLRIDGQIRTKNVTTDQMKITFVDGDTKIIYKPIDIIGYGYENIDENEFGEDVKMWRHYKSKIAVSFAPKAFASKEVFMEIMEEGEVTLYDYYVETPGNIENPYKRFFYMERIGSSELTELSQDNYVAVATAYFEDNYELSSKIGTVNHRFHNLWKIVRIYNDWYEMQNAAPAADYDSDYSETAPF